MRGSVIRSVSKASKTRTPRLAAETTRRRGIAEAIVEDIMTGGFGRAERLVLEVNGRDGDGDGWARECLIDRIAKKLEELQA